AGVHHSAADRTRGDRGMTQREPKRGGPLARRGIGPREEHARHLRRDRYAIQSEGQSLHVGLSEQQANGRLAVRRQTNGGADHTGHLERSEEHTSELQSRGHLVCRLLLEKKKKKT